MGIFKRLMDRFEESTVRPRKPTTLPEDHTLHKESFKVIGMSYHAAALSRIRTANPEWRMAKKKRVETGAVQKYVWHYTYPDRPVELRVDPTNEYGQDRIMVFLAGEHIGYLPEGDSVHVGEILRFCSIKYIMASAEGGEYQWIDKNGDSTKNENPMKVTVFVGYAVK